MEHINRIELKGTVGNLRISEIGDSTVANFSLVTNIVLPSKNNPMETTWHNIVAWSGGIPTETLNALSKGQSVSVVGRMRTRSYTTVEGEDRTSYEVIARNLEIIQEKS